MSRSVDLFIDSPLELSELARCLGGLMRTPLTPAADRPVFELREGNTVAELGEHSYIDDGALLLSRYRYNLSARFAGDRSMTDSPEVALVRHMADLVRERIGIPVLVVIDLEHRDAGPERPSEREAGPERPSEREAGPERPSEREAGPTAVASASGEVDR